MTLVGDATVVDVPLLWAQSTNKLLVVRNHHDTTLELANSDGQTTKRVTIQEIGWSGIDVSIRYQQGKGGTLTRQEPANEGCST